MVQLETLNELTIIDLAKTLAFRIGERFGDRGLTDAARNLAAHARYFTDEAKSLGRRNWALETLALVVFVGGTAGIAYLLYIGNKVGGLVQAPLDGRTEFFQALQGIDAGIHILVLTALSMLFFIGVDTRKKRRRALARLHSLRSYAHVVDMHQLNKDPAAIASGLPSTASSPKRDLGPQELLRYLDYCSEMLSLISKFAALYAQHSRDPVVIATVNEIELLTSSLSGKIWQKLIILHAAVTRENLDKP